MKIYVVSIVEHTNNPNTRYCLDLSDIHYATSYANAISFLKRAREDKQSGVNDETMINIFVDYLDEYFSPNNKILVRQPLRDFLRMFK